MFPRNLYTAFCDGYNYYIILTSQYDGAAVNVYNSHTNSQSTYSLDRGQVKRLTYNFETYTHSQDNRVLNGKIIEVRVSCGEIRVHLELQCFQSPFMYTVHPITTAHTEYYGMVSQRRYMSPHQFVVVAKFDNTLVTIRNEFHTGQVSVVCLFNCPENRCC